MANSKSPHYPFLFFSRKNAQIIGSVALMPTKTENIFELTKMAVLTNYRGLKIGQTLLDYCIDFVKRYAHQLLKQYLFK